MIFICGEGLTCGAEDGTSRVRRLGTRRCEGSSTGRAQLEGQNLGYGRNLEVLPGGGDPGGVEPSEMAKVGVRWLL